MEKKVTIDIDGVAYYVPDQKNLVEAIRDLGLEIPTLCFYPHIQPPLGTCRVCMLQVNGHHVCGCESRAAEGMNIQLHTAELDDHRKAMVELTFAEGNHFCQACEKSGDCDLQGLGYQMGIGHGRFPHLFVDRLLDFRGRRLVIEPNRCILCQRCVQEIRTADDQPVFSIVGRGDHTQLQIDEALESCIPDEMALRATQICPTGAILYRGKSLSRTPGDRQYDVPTELTEQVDVIQLLKSARLDRKWRVATTSLAGCFGCHMSLLDIDTGLLDVVELIELDRSPLTDIKHISGRCDIGLVEGGCGSDENVHVLKEFREHCDVLVAVGECAIWGGLPAMRNMVPLDECLKEAYVRSGVPGLQQIPHHEDLPAMLDRVYACSEVVPIDFYIPGCPPGSPMMWQFIASILTGTSTSLIGKVFKYD
ncbi:MAG: (2Fe-2S)-binding protein [Saprospiraceae bacterium]|nr:(2Fe-2S)-binding protein [Saprospiraceae bacterium]